MRDPTIEWNDNVVFTPWTTVEDANALLAQGRDGGAAGAIGLFPDNNDINCWYHVLVYLWSVLSGMLMGRR